MDADGSGIEKVSLVVVGHDGQLDPAQFDALGYAEALDEFPGQAREHCIGARDGLHDAQLL